MYLQRIFFSQINRGILFIIFVAVDDFSQLDRESLFIIFVAVDVSATCRIDAHGIMYTRFA